MHVSDCPTTAMERLFTSAVEIVHMDLLCMHIIVS